MTQMRHDNMAVQASIWLAELLDVLGLAALVAADVRRRHRPQTLVATVLRLCLGLSRE